MPRVARALRASLRPALLFAFGVGVSLYCGRRGFMPLDQSIVFDGGWRVLQGQLPFRDYVAPNGFVPHALQALFFAAFGVTWLAYCLHAALLNGLFAAGVDHGLRAAGARPALAFGCGAGSALVLSPPVGVPYMDSHAFFFSLAAVGAALEARRRESRALWTTLPALLVLAALSKQIPSVFALAIVLAVAFAPPGPVRRRARDLALGAGLAVLVVGGAAGLLGVEAGLVRSYFLEVPAGEAPRRLGGLPSVAADLARQAQALGLVSPLAVVGSLCGAAVLARRQRWRVAAPCVLATALLGMSAGYAVLTLNQVALALPPLFAAVGLCAVGLERVHAAAESPGRARVARALAVVLGAAAVLDAWTVHTRVNLPRSANDIRFEAERAVAVPDLPALAFLAWQTPPTVPYTARDLSDLVRFLREADAPFLLLGDASILYGLTGQPSVAPALWIHAGLTLPRPGDPGHAAYEDWLLARMDALGVRYVVLEGRHTWNHTTLDDFPRLAARIVAKKTPRRRFGGFRVVDLGPSGP